VINAVQELFESLARHPVRSLLTAGSVAWGLFVLVLLLGLGNGLQNGVAWMFRDDATNSLWVYQGETTKPFKGHRIGRPVRFRDADFDALQREVDELEHITGRFRAPVDPILTYNGRYASFDLRSVHPDHQIIEGTQIIGGRFLNPRDLDHKRKVIVIGREVAEFLFRGSDPLGEWVDLAGTPFRVVGVFEDVGGSEEMKIVYIPITTSRALFRGADRMHQIMFTIGDGTVEESQAIEEEVRAALGQRHHFDPADRRAVRVRNNVERYGQVLTLFGLLRAFVWVVGLGTVLAGVVGVSNIMLVSVKERTAEIGLRKAVGARPAGIVRQIVAEAVLLTTVSGYIGLVAGVAAIELLARFMTDNEWLREPSVDLRAAGLAALTLVLFGALAGFFPAWRAASIHPIEALRDA